MKEIQAGLRTVFRVWWAFAWRAVVIGWGLTAVLLLLLMLLGVNTEAGFWGPAILAVLSIVIHIGAQVWAFRQIIGMDFDDFRLVLAETFVQAQLRRLEEGSSAI